MAKKQKAQESRWRNMTTDDVVLDVLANDGGEVLRRDLARRIAHRYDFAAALARLSRMDRIELIQKSMPGRRPQSIVRLIGKDAQRAGVGFQRMGVKS